MDVVAIPARKLLAPDDEQKPLPQENKPGKFLGSESPINLGHLVGKHNAVKMMH